MKHRLPHFSVQRTPVTLISNWIKINDDKFHIVSGDVQLSMGSHADISVKLDIKSNPNYYTFFIKMYEYQSQGMSNNLTVGEIKFDMYHKNFISMGTLIKSIDVNFDDELNILFTCDYFVDKNIQEIRDDTIDDILS